MDDVCNGVKRYRVNTLPGRITRDCPEVVLASDYDALLSQLEAEKLDASRYRWLKSKQQTDLFVGGRSPGGAYKLTGSFADNAIDAAIQGEAK